MATTFDGLREILVEDFELPAERLLPGTPLEEIELDSLAVTELIFELEDKFGVTAERLERLAVVLGGHAELVLELEDELGHGE